MNVLLLHHNYFEQIKRHYRLKKMICISLACDYQYAAMLRI
jgi:hypothetical protein